MENQIQIEKRNFEEKIFSLKDLLGKIPDIVIAEMLNLSRERIRQYRDGLGINKYIPKYTRQTKYDYPTIDEMLRNNIPLNEIIQKTGIPSQTLYSRRRKNGIKIQNRCKYDWEKIKQDYLNPELSITEITNKYGISHPSHISCMMKSLFNLSRRKKKNKKRK